MGEIADYFIEMGIERECNFEFDPSEEDDDTKNGNGQFYGPRIITCRYCHATGFHWELTRNGYRLFKNGNMHDCLSQIKDDGDDRDDPDVKPLIGRIQLGRRDKSCIPKEYAESPIVNREVIKSANIKITEAGTIVYDWKAAKQAVAKYVGPNQYVEMTTTSINGKLAWILKLKLKKIKS